VATAGEGQDGMTVTRCTRRELVVGAGAALVLADPVSALLRGRDHVAWAGDDLAALLRDAPRARHWVSAATPGVDCLLCHAKGEVAKVKKHNHGTAPVRCQLCARNCLIAQGERGMCRARVNVGGELRTLVYGRPIATNVDPIEKKPFYHFLPGAQSYSLATSGCPLRCKFCQNWEISQSRPEDYTSPFVSPETLAADAVARRAPVIAFTYNEPTVFFEYLVDTARKARERGLRCVLISCGYMNEKPLAEMCEVLSAIKIDLKGFSPGFYRDVTGAELQPVLRSIKQVARSGVHLEIVNLVVPTLNDSEPMLESLCAWVASELGPDVPLHFTRFHPDYQLRNLPPTPVSVLERAREMAQRAGLRYAYVGNVPGHPGNHTYCPHCGKTVLERRNMFVTANNMEGGRCKACQGKVAGVWA
jgi:pyruvate formate lyase activating enzyme